MSVIIDELPANKVVYVTGQEYVDGVAWHVAQYDGTSGYIRADMLRMMSSMEEAAFLEEATQTEEPEPVITLPPYNPNSLSCYGYVSADSVNFRSEPSMNGTKIGRLKKYALCIVYDTVSQGGDQWLRVSYNGQTGYVNGGYFKQMTVSEADAFFASPQYLEGIANNTEPSSVKTNPGSSQPATTGTPTGVVSAEDQRVNTWTNPNSEIKVSYKPFDPFATPAPLPENSGSTPGNTEYLDSLAERIRNGSLKEEDLQNTLEIAYQDNSNKEETIAAAIGYIREKTGTGTAQPAEESPVPTESPEVKENIAYEQDAGQGGGFGWLIGGIFVLGAAGAGYAVYANRNRKREAAQRMARKRVAQQRAQNTGSTGSQTHPTVRPQASSASRIQQPGTAGMGASPEPGNAQQAARIRNGIYTGNNGKSAPGTNRTTAGGQGSVKPYSRNVDNPYGRYTSGTEDDADYTASFKPEGNRESSSISRRRRNPDQTKTES